MAKRSPANMARAWGSPRRLLVDLVALRTLPRLRLGVLGRVRLAGARAASPGMGRCTEGRIVGIRGIARILALLVGIGPLGRVGLAHRGVERVVRVLVLRDVPRVPSRRLGKAGGRLVLWRAHFRRGFPARGGSNARA